MVRKTVRYTDFNGQNVVEDLYFNLSKVELIRLSAEYGGDLPEALRGMKDSGNDTEFALFLDRIFLDAYGIKSEDGKRFIKSSELREAFKQSIAYETLFEDVFSSEDELIAFVEGLFPPAPASNTPAA